MLEKKKIDINPKQKQIKIDGQLGLPISDMIGNEDDPTVQLTTANSSVRFEVISLSLTQAWFCEPVWPSGKALVRLVSRGTSIRIRFDFPFSLNMKH